MKRAYEKRELDKEHIPMKYCTNIQNMDSFMALGISACETLIIEIHQRQFSSNAGTHKRKMQWWKRRFIPQRIRADENAA